MTPFETGQKIATFCDECRAKGMTEAQVAIERHKFVAEMQIKAFEERQTALNGGVMPTDAEIVKSIASGMSL